MPAFRSLPLLAGAALVAIAVSSCGGAGAGDLATDPDDPMTLFDQALRTLRARSPRPPPDSV